LQLLWIENNRRFTEVVLHTFLQSHAVALASSLTEARRRLASETFDAVLIDYDLDDGKDTELFPLILSLPNHPLLVAASSHAEGNARLLQAGADTVCSKREFASIELVLAAKCG
jgi:DNA-binding response OmpR family regulator